MSPRETTDVADAVVRMIRAVGRRVAGEDPEQLAELQKLDQALAEAWSLAVYGLRDGGASDRAIGEALGVSRQAVASRWRHTTHRSGAQRVWR